MSEGKRKEGDQMDFTTSELKCLWNMISISTVNRKTDLNAIEKSVRSKIATELARRNYDAVIQKRSSERKEGE